MTVCVSLCLPAHSSVMQAVIDLVISKVIEAAGGRRFKVVASVPGVAQIFLCVSAWISALHPISSETYESPGFIRLVGRTLGQDFAFVSCRVRVNFRQKLGQSSLIMGAEPRVRRSRSVSVVAWRVREEGRPVLGTCFCLRLFGRVRQELVCLPWYVTDKNRNWTLSDGIIRAHVIYFHACFTFASCQLVRTVVHTQNTKFRTVGP